VSATAAPARLSALIVNYRAYDELDACLTSLARALDLSRDEIIVVDHDSDPGRRAQIAERFPHVRLIPTDTNPGFGTGINTAAAQATGRVLLVLNPDAEASAGLGHQLVDWFDTESSVGVVGPLVRRGDGVIDASARRFPGWSTVFGGRSTWLTNVWSGNPISRRNLLTGPDVTEPIDVDWISGACMAIRRDVFELLGGFDEQFFMYWEDADLCKRAHEAGWRVVYDPRVSVRHLGARSSQKRPVASTIAFHRSVLRYYLKHGGPGRVIGAPVVYLALQARLAFTVARATLVVGGTRQEDEGR
jgi:GT2 family glycosyltransferase